MQPVCIKASGMVTSVGLTARTSCAAIRAGISRNKESRFFYSQEWIYASEVPMEINGLSLLGREKLMRMAVMAAVECLGNLPNPDPEMPLVLCVAEKERPGRYANLGAAFLQELRTHLNLNPAVKGSTIIEEGKIGVALAFQAAERYLSQTANAVLVVGVDSYLRMPTLDVYGAAKRLMTEESLDGFSPGEGAGALLLTRAEAVGRDSFICRGVGLGDERATIDSEEPFKAEGLTAAIKAALADARCTFKELDYRIVDVNGEYYAFKEASLALLRSMHVLKEEFDIWHPAECIGETGAAAGPLVLGVALDAARKGYAPGEGVLCHFANDDGKRAAMVLRYSD